MRRSTASTVPGDHMLTYVQVMIIRCCRTRGTLSLCLRGGRPLCPFTTMPAARQPAHTSTTPRQQRGTSPPRRSKTHEEKELVLAAQKLWILVQHSDTIARYATARQDMKILLVFCVYTKHIRTPPPTFTHSKPPKSTIDISSEANHPIRHTHKVVRSFCSAPGAGEGYCTSDVCVGAVLC